MNQQAETFLADAQSLANEVDDFKQVHVSRPHESAPSARERPRELYGRHSARRRHAARRARHQPESARQNMSMNFDAVRATPGVAVFTADDIPGVNDCGPLIHDDSVLAQGIVQYVGQPMFIVVATSHDTARLAARRVMIEFEDLVPILTL